MPKLIVFYKDQIVLTANKQFIELDAIASFSKNLADYFLNLKNSFQLVNFNNDYYTVNITQEILNNFADLSDVFLITSIRTLMLYSDLAINHNKIHIITKARQLAHWHADHQYCGRCGTKTFDIINNHHKEYAKECKNCGLLCYPRITPCILAAIIKNVDDHKQLLLGRSPHFPAKVYSLLAGFIEVGESAEETVIREVYEETRINIKNICYFGSQPWPFPHSLMLAYVGEYSAGEILIDANELEDAKWVNFKDIMSNSEMLPPAKGSLSRMLIDHLADSD